MANKNYRSLITSPQALKGLGKGLDQLASLMAFTLGPSQGVIVNAVSGTGQPEYLSESGIIARRVVELPGAAENAGAMILRTMATQLHEKCGDGAATAAVLARAMVKQSTKLIAAGANPMRMRSGIEKGAAAARKALERQAVKVSGQDQLTYLAVGATGDPELGAMLGEMFDVLGQYATLTVHEFYSPYLEREYLDGGRWTARPGARDFLPEGKPEITYENPRVVVTDAVLEKLDQVRPMLELAYNLPDNPKRPLVIFARDFKGDALTTLLANTNRGVLTICAMVPAANQMPIGDELDDMALMSGANFINSSYGKLLENIRVDDFGQARRIIASRTHTTIVGGMGKSDFIQKRILDLRSRLGRINRIDKEWEAVRLRTARLAGGVGILKIGAFTEKDRNYRKELAIKAQKVLEMALEGGVLPGGGVAYLNCVSAVESILNTCQDEDEAYGVKVVASALEAPFLQLVTNSALVHPPIALTHARKKGRNFGYNVTTGEYVDMLKAGVLDTLIVSRSALDAAASAASMAITTGTIILSPDRRREKPAQRKMPSGLKIPGKRNR